MRFLTLVLLLSGCGIVAGPSPADPTCAYYDEAHLAWSAVGMAASGLAASGSTVLAVWPGTPPDDAVIGVGVTSAALGVLSTVAGMIEGHYTQRWTQAGCGGVD
jgi:hypothetical protein